MNESLHDLLNELSWNPSHDILFFAGDLLAKSEHSTSLAVWDFIYKNHINEQGRQVIYPVRGNHDHMVVQWRAWRDWFEGLLLPTPRRHHHHVLLSSLPFTIPSFDSLFASNSSEDSDAAAIHTGRDFLNLIEAEWVIASTSGNSVPPDPEEWVEVTRKRARGTWREAWWARIPKTPSHGHDKKAWKMFSDHYWLARDMERQEAEWLMKEVPLVNWISGLHAFVVHAGVLPGDPTLKMDDERQPLARIPGTAKAGETAMSVAGRVVVDEGPMVWANTDGPRAQEPLGLGAPSSDTSIYVQPNSNISALRRFQERDILTLVPQNTDPWVVLNMRSVKKNGKVTRTMDKGTPWSDLWADAMKHCKGFGLPGEEGYDVEADPFASLDHEGEAQASKKHGPKKYNLKCYPSTVIYGHAATRGLDVKRWSFGLDTGCLYGRKLTALVLSQKGHPDEEQDDDDGEDVEALKRLRFGDSDAQIKAKLVSVKCPNIDDDDDD
ncbi:hypothetical protein BC629DRAFT_1229190 [Irpex lacteus]|nr:hypothetical protein BC629DRAFT_1229190 [Irpex lacteus]